jgi:hypothetical protein
MKDYNHIAIVEHQITYNNKPVYDVINNKTLYQLGILYHYGLWGRYVFAQYNNHDIIFDSQDLKDIADFIDNEIPK